MHLEQSPGTSPSQPISIGRMQSSPTGSFLSLALPSSSSSSGSPASSRTQACSFPSWPQGSSLSSGPGSFRSSAPSSFISDEDLFLDELDGEAPLLSEAPAPPREVPMAQAFPLLPLYASEKPQKKKSSNGRRSSARSKPRRSSKPMTPISESPETPE